MKLSIKERMSIAESAAVIVEAILNAVDPFYSEYSKEEYVDMVYIAAGRDSWDWDVPDDEAFDFSKELEIAFMYFIMRRPDSEFIKYVYSYLYTTDYSLECVVSNELLEDEADSVAETKLFKALSTFYKFSDSYETSSIIKEIGIRTKTFWHYDVLDSAIKMASKFELKKAKLMKDVLSDYMFYVDENLFGTQTNSFGTVGHIIEWDMLLEPASYFGYDMMASISPNVVSPMHNLRFVIAVSLKNNSSRISINIYNAFTQYVSPTCVNCSGLGVRFTNITYDITNDYDKDREILQKLICKALNKCYIKAEKCASKHSDFARILDIGEKVPLYPYLYDELCFDM